MPEAKKQQKAPVQAEPEEAEQQPAAQPDVIANVIQAIADRKIKLATLKQQNPKEYDRFLRTGFPLEAYTLIERVTIEVANRVQVLFQMLAEAEVEHEAELAAQFAEEHEDAVRVLALFVQGLDMDLPQDVQDALEVIIDEGILDEETDDGQENEESDASQAPREQEPEHNDGDADGDAADGDAAGDTADGDTADETSTDDGDDTDDATQA